MITGHFGLAYGVRAIRKDAPLLLLLGAAVLPDMVDVAYALVGVCSPFGLYSHSLPAITVLAFVAGAVGRAILCALVALQASMDAALPITRRWGTRSHLTACVRT